MNKLFSSKNDYIKLFLLLSFSLCWISISSSTSDLHKFYFILYKNYILGNTPLPTLNELVNFFRQAAMFIIFPVLFYLNFSKLRMMTFKKNYGFFFLLLYFVFQIPGLILTNNSYFNIGFIISSINIILILNLNEHFFNKKFLKNFLYLVLFFLILINFLNINVYVKFFTTSNASDLYSFYGRGTDIFFGQDGPRSTGSSRTLLLIYIVSIIVFKKFFESNNVIKYILYILVATFILLFQSRTVVILLLTFIIFNFYIEKNKNFIKYFFIYVLLPILSIYSLVYLKNTKVIEDFMAKQSIKNEIGQQSYFDNSVGYVEAINENLIRPIDPGTFSSGRIKDWNNIITKGIKSKYIGFGAQGDRYLINQTASNGLLYAFASSGIIGIIFYIFFLFSCIFKIFSILIKDRKRLIIEKKLYSLIILIILLRSLLESSFSVFGIDLIVMCTFYNLLNIKFKDEHAN